MSSNLKSFVDGLPEQDKLGPAQLVDWFMFFVTEVLGEPEATSAYLEQCFRDCDLPVFGRLRPHLSEGLKGSAPRYVKTERGYRLSRSQMQKLRAMIGENRNVTVSLELRKLHQRLSDASQKTFLQEVVTCFEGDAFRASIVMAWSLAVHVLQKHILDSHLDVFNAAIAKRTERNLAGFQIRVFDDFSDLKESTFIELARSSGVISNDVRKILDAKLGLRNTCAHPSSVVVAKSKALEAIEDLMENVVLKYA